MYYVCVLRWAGDLSRVYSLLIHSPCMWAGISSCRLHQLVASKIIDRWLWCLVDHSFLLMVKLQPQSGGFALKVQTDDPRGLSFACQAGRQVVLSAINTHVEEIEMLSCAADFTLSAPIPQPHLSSHELMRWNRVQPSWELFLLVLSGACTIFPHEILQPARDTAKGASKQLGRH